MCTAIHFALPVGADVSAIGGLTEDLGVGRGLLDDRKSQRVLRSMGVLGDGERLYLVRPWMDCHCGWSPANFAPVAQAAIRKGFARRVGVLASEHGTDLSESRRVKVLPDAFADGRFDEQDTLYLVEPDRSPRKVTPRHGPRRRRKKPL